MTQIDVKIRKLRETAVIPRYATDGAAGFDLIAADNVVIEPGQTQLVPLGLAFELPDGYELQIRPRSGISLRTYLRIANAPGTIDADYRGEIAVIVDNIRPLIPTMTEVKVAPSGTYQIGYKTQCSLHTLDGGVTDFDAGPLVPFGTYLIRAGDRIGQGVIAPVVRATFSVTEALTETLRGADGFGSTGLSS